jgi:hypothetical protein
MLCSTTALGLSLGQLGVYDHSGWLLHTTWPGPAPPIWLSTRGLDQRPMQEIHLLYHPCAIAAVRELVELCDL